MSERMAPIGVTHYDVPNPKDHNYGDPPRDYPEIMPGDVDAYGRRYCWEVRSNVNEEDA
jgi:hypothetical protein